MWNYLTKNLILPDKKRLLPIWHSQSRSSVAAPQLPATPRAGWAEGGQMLP